MNPKLTILILSFIAFFAAQAGAGVEAVCTEVSISNSGTTAILNNGCLRIGIYNVTGGTSGSGKLMFIEDLENNINLSNNFIGNTGFSINNPLGTRIAQSNNPNIAYTTHSFGLTNDSSGVTYKRTWNKFNITGSNISFIYTKYIKLYNSSKQIDIWFNIYNNDTVQSAADITFSAEDINVNTSIEPNAYWVIPRFNGVLHPVLPISSYPSSQSYPSNMWNMQFIGLWHNNSNVGLIAYFNDTNGTIKTFSFQNLTTGGINAGLDFKIKALVEYEQNYTSPHLIIRPVVGDYIDIANVYKTWVYNQSFANVTNDAKLARTPDLQKLIDNGVVFTTNNGFTQGAQGEGQAGLLFSTTTAIFQNISSFYGITGGIVHSWNWQNGFINGSNWDRGYPDVLPPSNVIDTLVNFSNMTNSLYALGYIPIIHDNAQWVNTSSSFNYDGVYKWNNANVSYTHLRGSDYMYPISAYYPNYLNNLTATVNNLSSYNLKGLFLDTYMTEPITVKYDNTSYARSNCTIITADCQTKGHRNVMNTLKQTNLTYLFGSEAEHEQLMEYFDYGEGGVPYGEEVTNESSSAINVPLFQYVHHDKLLISPHGGVDTIELNGELSEGGLDDRQTSDQVLLRRMYVYGWGLMQKQWINNESVFSKSYNSSYDEVFKRQRSEFKLLWNFQMTDNKILDSPNAFSVQYSLFEKIGKPYGIITIMNPSSVQYTGNINISSGTDAWDLFNHKYVCQNCNNFSTTIDAYSVVNDLNNTMVYVNGTLNQFNLTSTSASLYDTAGNLIDDSVPVQITSNTLTSIKFNSTQNYTGVRLQVVIPGDKRASTGKTYFYIPEGLGYTQVPNANVTYNGSDTIFDLHNIDVIQSSNSNELLQAYSIVYNDTNHAIYIQSWNNVTAVINNTNTSYSNVVNISVITSDRTLWRVKNETQYLIRNTHYTWNATTNNVTILNQNVSTSREYTVFYTSQPTSGLTTTDVAVGIAVSAAIGIGSYALYRRRRR